MTGAQGLWRGFRALLPLWVAAVPSGLAFGAAAREAGLTGAVAQSMSLLVYSAPAQLAALHAAREGVATVGAIALALGVSTPVLLVGAVARSWTRLLEHLPAVTLTALVVTGLAARPEEAAWRWPAAAGAALMAARRARMEVCVAVGMGIYGLLRLLATR